MDFLGPGGGSAVLNEGLVLEAVGVGEGEFFPDLVPVEAGEGG